MIYQPSEDSYLLQKVLIGRLRMIGNKNLRILEKQEGFKILDMGTGSGIQAKACKEAGFDNNVVSDINPEVIANMKKLGFEAIESDLFSNINEKFDLIIFNPPYLPEDEREPGESRLQTTGGKEGCEIIIRFLKRAVEHLSGGGRVLLLFSSLSNPNKILDVAKGSGYEYKLLDREKLDFEELFVYEFWVR
ncbi:methyltransferase [Candidatus Pacearchaeota archaeon]|nr:methyltransferase [Candidatus Pacearchaeota archaeon]